MKHYPPAINQVQFHCPLCGVYAAQVWSDCKCFLWSEWRKTEMRVSLCSHCEKITYWYKDKMVVPSSGTVELPNPDMPEDCKAMSLGRTYLRQVSASLCMVKIIVQSLYRVKVFCQQKRAAFWAALFVSLGRISCALHQKIFTFPSPMNSGISSG